MQMLNPIQNSGARQIGRNSNRPRLRQHLHEGRFDHLQQTTRYPCKEFKYVSNLTSIIPVDVLAEHLSSDASSISVQ
jgi:hypothetical protein